MNQARRFEELIVWQEAIRLAKEVFLVNKNCRNFSLKNQLERAVISISANIAEGFELNTNKQFVRHLFIAKVSCGEVRSLLTLAKELELFTAQESDPLIDLSGRLSVMIFNLIRVRRLDK